MKIIMTATKGSYLNFYLLLQQEIIDPLCLKTDTNNFFDRALVSVLSNLKNN